MSAGFALALIGAPLKLWFSISSISLVVAVVALCCMLLCSFRQRLNLVFPSVSMRLMPRRTCSGVECFGDFHIKQRFFYLFLFLRGDFT
ncbi:hypothetical protein Pint_23273 [Pistacia integerrima]|uniref:Uncharacterized protein n=1 Tax=Pistacia integerrima TaxID=434235 RepID=A0ACC0YLD2_9ROSI|nr:hypothetical protein Pint_23273 [Pistacia integerrima]